MMSTYSIPGSKIVENGCWWECDKLTKPQGMEGMFLFHFKNSTGIFVIEICKSSINDDKLDWQDQCKPAFDLDQIVSADTAYLEAATNDDTIAQLQSSCIIKSLAWRDDMCLIGHGYGKLTILKTRANVGGV